MLKALLLRIGALLHPVYLAMDGHFGNYPAFQMVRQCGLHLISKLRWDAALCFPAVKVLPAPFQKIDLGYGNWLIDGKVTH